MASINITKIQRITIDWWSVDDSVEMKDYFESQLMDHADDHINEMVAEGYTSGELNHTISGDGVEFRGWWEIKED